MQRHITKIALTGLLISNLAIGKVVTADAQVCMDTVGTQYKKADCLHTIMTIDDACVAQAKAVVAHEFQINGYMRSTCKAIAAGVILYTAYKVVEAQFARRGAAQVRPGVIALPGDSTPVTRAEFERFKQSIDPNWFTWQWAKNWAKHLGKGLVSMAVTKGLFDAGDRLMGNIFHDGNLEWFFKTHTQTIETMNELNGYVQQYAACGGNSAQAELCKKEIIAVANSFLRQITVLIAFIEYQRDQFSVDSPAYAEATNLLDYVRISANDFGQSLQKALNNNGKGHNAMMESIAKFAAEFARCVGSFERIEKEQAVTA